LSNLDSCIHDSSGSKPSILDNWILHYKTYRKRRVKCDKKVDKKRKKGTSFGIDSKVLFHEDNLGEHDLWLEQYVMEKGSDGDGEDLESKCVGVVENSFLH
jgi:hypothetical protein